jgi:hypothetical protein
MTKITSVSVSFGGTINLGNFSNAKVDIGASADVGDADPAEAYDKLREFVMTRVRAEYAAIKKGQDNG